MPIKYGNDDGRGQYKGGLCPPNAEDRMPGGEVPQGRGRIKGLGMRG